MDEGEGCLEGWEEDRGCMSFFFFFFFKENVYRGVNIACWCGGMWYGHGLFGFEDNGFFTMFMYMSLLEVNLGGWEVVERKKGFVTMYRKWLAPLLNISTISIFS